MYTYEKCVTEYAKRRSKANNFRNLKDKSVLTQLPDGAFELSKNGARVNVYPDNRMQVYLDRDYQSAIMFAKKVSGLYIGSQKKDTRQQNIRVAGSWSGWSDNLPFFNGMWCKGGAPLHPEQHVDVMRTVNKEKSLELQRKYLRELSKVTRVMAKMDIIDTPEGVRRSYYDHSPSPAAVEELLTNGVSGTLAEMVAGSAVWSAKSNWYYRNKQDDQQRQQARISAATTALAKFASALYARLGVYEWAPK